MIRLEGKFPGDHLIETADELGIPVMYGWMCCNQWEKWAQWDDEDRRVAQDSTALADRGAALARRRRSSGPTAATAARRRRSSAEYHGILSDLHWQNATSTPSPRSTGTPTANALWDGIQMAGPVQLAAAELLVRRALRRHPRGVGRAGRQRAHPAVREPEEVHSARQALADQRHLVLPRRLQRQQRNSSTASGPPSCAGTGRRTAPRSSPAKPNSHTTSRPAPSSRRSPRAAGTRHKMTIYWMLNNHWPSFFGNLFDYYLRPGGAYYGAKKGLRPLSVVFDSYATGDHSQANITVVNQSADDRTVCGCGYGSTTCRAGCATTAPPRASPSPPAAATKVMTLPREALDSRVFFVRCDLMDASGAVVADNVYWQSQQRDDVGNPRNDTAFSLKQVSWADMTPLNTMPRVPLDVTAHRTTDDGRPGVTVRLPTTPDGWRSSNVPKCCPPTTATRSCRSSTATTTSRCSPGNPSNCVRHCPTPPPTRTGFGCRATTPRRRWCPSATRHASECLRRRVRRRPRRWTRR